ncbi:hypothetical protein MKK70_08200 [Methylobacterium sp. E-041]|uniref:hypothetical protein n=1 Tax=Methylobacterium sp. E-041 TaxID=2836573 RepID=UPI001FB99D66|nr:hypothetical protein [Methylobacterium sp. E-041]MCJ2105363.1 hypothetical protein [Methylobacterium sp. E-041]
MPKFLVTYDLQDAPHDPHATFIAEAEGLGWHAWSLSGRNVWYKLPNTTLRGEFNTLSSAVAAFKKVWTATRNRGYRVTIEKWIVVECVAASYDSDVQQPSE